MGEFNPGERGIALIFVLFASMLLTLLGLSLSFSSLTEVRLSSEFELQTKAFDIAEAGFGITRASLENQEFNTLLIQSTTVPQYISYTEPQPGTTAYRNPLLPLEARSINFSAPPASIGNRQLKGFLTAAAGVALGEGRYFARLTDNQDEPLLGLLDDPDVDVDGTVYLRVMGLQPGLPMEVVTYGSSIKNSVAIIEGLLRRDLTFHTSSGFALYGQDASGAQNNPNNFFNGSAFTLDGYDHSGWSTSSILANHGDGGTPASVGLGVAYDDPLNGDALAVANEIYNSLNPSQRNRITGMPGLYGPTPSLIDITEQIRTSTTPGATNLFSADFLGNFARKVISVADVAYDDDTSLSGSNITLGTPSQPQITAVTGDLEIGGSGSGNGLLVVTGEFRCQGNFTFDGLVLVIGEGRVIYGAGTLIGGVFFANVSETSPGNYEFGTPSFTVSGSTEIYHKGDSVRLALSLLPLRTVSWREITPEIEP